MADKTSTILIKAQVEGTQKGTADLNNLGAAADNSGRRFRNMGDHARDSARSFSDAAKGMGGFVGSYAGASATFFAIQQGFSALANAAKFDQTIQGTKTLATAMGESGDKIMTIHSTFVLMDYDSRKVHPVIDEIVDVLNRV